MGELLRGEELRLPIGLDLVRLQIFFFNNTDLFEQISDPSINNNIALQRRTSDVYFFFNNNNFIIHRGKFFLRNFIMKVASIIQFN